ncbi:MAG: hypothetical protein FWK04_12620 [Nostoc sp. GBBB01]|nr:hypothetical protein [Nostoc sp. GBBB01]
MAEPTLTDVFGAGAEQDEDTLTIQKSSLAGVGLTPSANNTAEALFVAVTLQAQQALSEESRDENIDQSIAVTDGFQPTTTTRNNAIYLRNTISVEVDKLLPNATIIDPDDY